MFVHILFRSYVFQFKCDNFFFKEMKLFLTFLTVGIVAVSATSVKPPCPSLTLCNAKTELTCQQGFDTNGCPLSPKCISSGKSSCILSCQWSHVVPCHVMPCHVMSCLVMSVMSSCLIKISASCLWLYYNIGNV